MDLVFGKRRGTAFGKSHTSHVPSMAPGDSVAKPTISAPQQKLASVEEPGQYVAADNYNITPPLPGDRTIAPLPAGGGLPNPAPPPAPPRPKATGQFATEGSPLFKEYIGLLGPISIATDFEVGPEDALLVIDMQCDFLPKDSHTNPDGGRFGVAEGAPPPGSNAPLASL